MCNRKLSLVQALSHAASRHANLAGVLSAHTGNGDQADFSAARADCEEATLGYETARTAFDSHCTVHGC